MSAKWFWLVIATLAGVLVWRLSPVLTPFMVSALLAYLGDPLVDRIESRGASRTASVAVVFALMFLGGITLILVLLPLLEKQIATLIHNLPLMLDWLERVVVPKLAVLAADLEVGVDAEALRETLLSHWHELGGFVRSVLGRVTTGGQILFGWLAYLLVVPVVTFYLLRDWDRLVANVHDLLPRQHERTVSRLARECDEVLAEFLRGQLLVMLCQAVVFVTGLWLVGLDLAFAIGVAAALVSFVPYLGTVVGVLLAGVAVIVQFHDVPHFLGVLAVFGVAQGLEGMVLSPLLVGDRIGLHPVAVIFAISAGGQLFGIFGMLLALPVAAVIMVLLRHTHHEYKASHFYAPAASRLAAAQGADGARNSESMGGVGGADGAELLANSLANSLANPVANPKVSQKANPKAGRLRRRAARPASRFLRPEENRQGATDPSAENAKSDVRREDV